MFALITLALFRVKSDFHIFIVCTLIDKSNIDYTFFGRYTALATAKSVAGRENPEFRAHNRAVAVFLCVKHDHIQIMVGRVGPTSVGPVPRIPGFSPLYVSPPMIVRSLGGELSSPESEAAIMATVPTFAHPEITITSGRAVTTSLAVAAYFGKRHDDILKKINNFECSSEFIARNFAVNEYTDSIGRTLPCYEMTRSGFMFLVMGFTGRKAALLKENYINAFDAMEAKFSGRSLETADRYQIVLTFENGVVVDSRAVLPGEYTCSMKTFFELVELQGYLVIHPDDLKALSFGARKRGPG
ncbi:Rha family transcriptional regulator [Enterobacter ludwigii]